MEKKVLFTNLQMTMSTWWEWELYAGWIQTRVLKFKKVQSGINA